MKDFVIAENSISSDCGWYIYSRKRHKHLHKDLKFYKSTGYEIYYGYGNSPGYYPSKEIAEAYLQIYLNLERGQIKFKISQYYDGWIVSPTEEIDGAYYYLWKDLELHRASTGYVFEKHSGRLGSAPGYYSSKQEAEIHSRLFKEKHKMKFTIRQSINNPERGWYIVVDEHKQRRSQFVWKDLELHEGTGYNSDHKYPGDAPGYYSSKLQAEINLETFKEKHKMADKIEIDVKINGVVTPLYKISERSLLTVRENSKPKEVPVARTANYRGSRRLILKISDTIKRRISEGSEVIVIDLKYGDTIGSWSLENDQHHYNGVNFYSDVKVLE